MRKLDYFYRRITVDFKTKKGHQFTYAAAVDMLESAPEDHILVLRQADPAAFEAMLKDRPGEFIKAVLKSFKAITEEYGFDNASYLKTIFKRRFKATMSEFRKQLRTT